jgi:hypothetical protein
MAGDFQPSESESCAALPVLVCASRGGDFADSQRLELAQACLRLCDCVAQPQIRVLIGPAVEETAVTCEVMAEAQFFIFNNEHNPAPEMAKFRLLRQRAAKL